ncbi:MAG: hypothetical protein WC348_04790 [Patescibacteria group bacterium]|jgi:hypothetical protein
MKRFFLKIWAGITAFFAWLVSPIATLFHGRKIPLPLERAADDIDYLNPGSRKYETWLGVVRRLAVLVKGKELLLGVTLPGFLADRFFQELRVVLFLRHQQVGIEYVTRMKGVRFYGGHEHILPLEAASEWDAAASKRRIKHEDYCVANVQLVTLAVSDETRDFELDEQSGFFIPAKTERRVA